MKSNLILSIVFLCFTTLNLAAENRVASDTTYIFLKEYGLQRTKDKNCIKYINKALDDDLLKDNAPKVLVFRPGVYHFYPDGAKTKVYYESNTTDVNPKVCAFLFENVHNLTIDGRGSTLIFHEQMQPFTFDNCSNIVLKNLSIDWQNPLIAQGEVLKVTDHYIDLAIDFRETPYRIEDGKLWFDVNRSKKNIWRSTMEFDRKGRYIVPQTGDKGCLGDHWQEYEAVTTMPGIVRLNNHFTRQPKERNFLVLRHAERAHSGIFINESKNVKVQNINLYHATGLGILAQFSEDLTFDAYRAVPNPGKNRYFGGGDDGIQVSNCKGQINIQNCEFAGLMDDPVNVHGTSVQIQQIVSPTQLKCRFMHHQSVGMTWGHKGDKISFIENERMNSLGKGEVLEFKTIDNENFMLTLAAPVPKELQVGDALENLTWSPDLTVRNNHFGNCRARGLLVSTPGKVLIENNVFESSGSAILISGDANGWFESGAVNDVLIQNNTFSDLCNTSPYQFCEAIISIYPIIPKLDDSAPAFHRNIRIINNEFHPFDFPVLFARSVDGLAFEGNTLSRSFNFEPYHERLYTFSFEYCKNIKLGGNQLSEDLLGKNILLKQTPGNELQLDQPEISDVVNY
ncbi:right-handed parallel beta-helix repeat-containing protein [Maribellus sediminis]|uniref:right-handed parallel beta-helix repeat-containing protein n=1 Tax=Maribellus sediminis TaxID=2696285 RepID=UPI001431014C|nr:right-handed parallel beta-helix repeat-containing protein [Maribellus sediminis]